MKLSKQQHKLIRQYNSPDTMLVVSTFPEKGKVHAIGMGGVASYTKSCMQPVAQLGQKVVVLADVIDVPEVYEDDGMLVVRCWERGSFGLYLSLLLWLMRFHRVKKVLVQFEFALYGDFRVTSMFPFFILGMRMMLKQPAVVLHQVVLNLSELSGHIGIQVDTIKGAFYSFLLGLYYHWLGFWTKQIVVLEEEFAKRLRQIGIRRATVTVIPHGVNAQQRKKSMKSSKKKLGFDEKDRVILLFGFLTWYKGADIAVKAFRQAMSELGSEGRNVHLVLAGGESVTQKKKKHYQRFIARLRNDVSETKNVWITGFVNEKDVPTYYGAADVVLMSYRVFMSSSGVLSLSLSHGKPMLVSKPLQPWFGEVGQHFFGVSKPKSLVNKIVSWAKAGAVSVTAKESRNLANRRSYSDQALVWRNIWNTQALLVRGWEKLYRHTYNFLWL